MLFLRPKSFGSGCEAVRLCDALPGEGCSRCEDPASGKRGSGLLLVEVEAEARCGALVLLLLLLLWLELDEDPARMREDHVGGMAGAARHRNPSAAIRHSAVEVMQSRGVKGVCASKSLCRSGPGAVVVDYCSCMDSKQGVVSQAKVSCAAAVSFCYP